ncbi:MAG: hypothetical protein A3D65_04855 [Candidatus Lloydbacteria bacterium RIFCSPHIGHO2_02_FULL_50_13]|uniref:Uncharacterized protein n=1 Tax=Candidatus Lloydbacteria bacterium RIFCSPHIGHO2_02_FULL_50_13 TaxID=1798661 RepID=A0A1G2D4I9_9BACT|nr:MAG: hypothetical protein A3D65_04855 [Candidatus Lloydbacteria bacterium RIFCSPHIGHO2_02_FULL_50_13]
MFVVHKLIRTFRLMWQDSPMAGEQLVRGSFVLVVGRLAIKAVQFVRTIVLAHLLFPEDFGLFGLAALSLGVMDLFLQPGFYAALIHERGDPHQYLDTVWSGQIMRNTFIGALVFFVAPLLGNFFAHPEIVPLTRVLALSLVIAGFENVGVMFFQKNMQFNRQFFFNMSMVLFEVVTVIIAGFVLRSVWALVIGAVAYRIGNVLLSYAFHPYRPKFAPKLAHFRHLLRYGKWVSLGAIVGYFVTQGDNFSVGKLIGPEGLGYYQAAFALALLPAAEFGRVLGNALFPAFAKLEAGRHKEAFTRISQIIFALTIPASLGIYALAPDIVHMLYGARWLPMAPIVSVLAFYALLRSFEAIGSPFFMGIGKPKVATIALFLQCLSMAILLPLLLTKFSTVGAAWAMLGSGCVSALVYIVALYREKLLDMGGIFQLITAPLFSGLIMIIVIGAAKTFVPIQNIFALLCYVGFGGLVYFLVLWCADTLGKGQIFTHFQWVRARVWPKKYL